MSNPNYIDNASVAVAQALSKDWLHILGQSSPMLALILGKEGGGNFNRGSSVQGDRTFTVPVIVGDTGVTFEGVSTANQLTPMARVMTADLTQAEYIIAHFRGLYNVTAEQTRFLSGAAGTYRGDHLKGVKAQVKNKVEKLLAPLVLGTQADSATAFMGMLRMTATANVVGGINQAVTTAWQSNVDNAAGPITMERVDLAIHDAQKRGNIDLLILSSHNTGPNVYQSFLGLIRGKETIQNNAGRMAKFGFQAAMFSGIELVNDRYFPTAATGYVLGLASDNLFVVGDKAPSFMPPNPIDGTDAFENVFSMFLGTGTNDPGSHFLISNITG